MKKTQTPKASESLRTVIRRQMGKLYRLCESKAHHRWYRGAKAHMEQQLVKLPKGIKVESVGYTKIGMHPVMVIKVNTGHKYHMKYDKPADAGWTYPSLIKAQEASTSIPRDLHPDACYNDKNYYADDVARHETLAKGKERIAFWRHHNQLTTAPAKS